MDGFAFQRSELPLGSEVSLLNFPDWPNLIGFRNGFSVQVDLCNFVGKSFSIFYSTFLNNLSNCFPVQLVLDPYRGNYIFVPSFGYLLIVSSGLLLVGGVNASRHVIVLRVQSCWSSTVLVSNRMTTPWVGESFIRDWLVSDLV